MPFVEQIDDRYHVQCGAAAVSRIHAVIDRNKTDMVHREYVVDVAADFDVITPEAGKVFYHHRVDLAKLCIGQQSLYAREPKAQNEKCPERA